MIPRVHAVTNDEIVARRDFLERAGRIMRALGPRGAVHLRASHLSGRALYALAERLAALQEETGAWLVVNDRVDVALAAGARGAQLTSRSMAVADARAIAPGVALGASVHALDEAVASVRAGADWLVAGHVFSTPSHAGEPGRGPAFVEELTRVITIPVIAIGGIVPKHVTLLRRLGVYGIAAIRGLWEPDDAERAAIDYLSRHDGDDRS